MKRFIKIFVLLVVLILASSCKTKEVATQKKILEPSIRVRIHQSVGGGTVISCENIDDNNFNCYILTAFHVVQSSLSNSISPGEVKIDFFDQNGSYKETVDGYIKKYDSTRDLCLIVSQTKKYYPPAKLMNFKYEDTIEIFSKVYAVGCPLGSPPMPTNGIVSRKNVEMSGVKFWVTSSPAIFGNSGGGIFLEKSNELIGVNSRIAYYRGNAPSQIITHIVFFVPSSEICKWLLEIKHERFVDYKLYLANKSVKRKNFSLVQLEKPDVKVVKTEENDNVLPVGVAVSPVIIQNN